MLLRYFLASYSRVALFVVDAILLSIRVMQTKISVILVMRTSVLTVQLLRIFFNLWWILCLFLVGLLFFDLILFLLAHVGMVTDWQK